MWTKLGKVCAPSPTACGIEAHDWSADSGHCYLVQAALDNYAADNRVIPQQEQESAVLIRNSHMDSAE